MLALFENVDNIRMFGVDTDDYGEERAVEQAGGWSGSAPGFRQAVAPPGVVMLGLTALISCGAVIVPWLPSGLGGFLSPQHQGDIFKSQTEPGERRPNLTPLNLDGTTL